jgi:hypothetical protein
MHAVAWAWIHANVRVDMRSHEIDSMLNHCEDVGVTSCSSDTLFCYNCTGSSLLLFAPTV